MVKKKKFNRSFSELPSIFGLLNDFFTRYDIAERIRRDVELSVEEIFTNMVRHNRSSRSKIEIRISRKGRKLHVLLHDREKIPFDITRAASPDTEANASEARQGGLGIHLVRKMMDDVSFEHKNGQSVITIAKNI